MYLPRWEAATAVEDDGVASVISTFVSSLSYPRSPSLPPLFLLPLPSRLDRALPFFLFPANIPLLAPVFTFDRLPPPLSPSPRRWGPQAAASAGMNFHEPWLWLRFEGHIHGDDGVGRVAPSAWPGNGIHCRGWRTTRLGGAICGGKGRRKGMREGRILKEMKEGNEEYFLLYQCA